MGDHMLERLRAARAFDPHRVRDAKVARINAWFRRENLDCAVVGVSGGVDSALVVALLSAARAAEGSPLRRIVAMILPVEGKGATGQSKAAEEGRRVAEQFNVDLWEAPLGSSLREMVHAIERAADTPFSAWAEGQCVSVLRTPALYGAAALLQSRGYRSVVVGTTNRDEGSYLGFYGKASDGMVDVQPIADLHKSEVRALAELLRVPTHIVSAAPRGDVHDGRTDEDMIGATYDDIETYLRVLELERDPRSLGVPNAEAIYKQHSVNRHKYAVGTPSVYLDVMPRSIPDGAQADGFSPRTETRPPSGVLAGEWDPPAIQIEPPNALPLWADIPLPADSRGVVRRISGALAVADCERLIRAMNDSNIAEPVGVTGVRDSYGVGSVRASAWAPDLAGALWKSISPAIPQVRFLSEMDPTDFFATTSRDQHMNWRVVGLSPLLRFMRYEKGGKHLCHYDAGFDYKDGRRTLMSVVFYLSNAKGSGATRFVRDGQEARPTHLRNFSDWDRDTDEKEVIARVYPSAGDVLVFDHRLCHDVEQWNGDDSRVIIRGDIVYEAIPDQKA